MTVWALDARVDPTVQLDLDALGGPVEPAPMTDPALDRPDAPGWEQPRRWRVEARWRHSGALVIPPTTYEGLTPQQAWVRFAAAVRAAAPLSRTRLVLVCPDRDAPTARPRVRRDAAGRPCRWRMGRLLDRHDPSCRVHLRGRCDCWLATPDLPGFQEVSHG